MPFITGGSGGGGSAGAVTLISTTTLSVAGVFDLTGIPQTFNDLMLVCLLRGADAGSTDAARMQFNADAGANYGGQYIGASNGTTGAAGLGASTSAYACRVVAAQGLGATIFTPVRIHIPFYTVTSYQKQTFSECMIGLGTGTAQGIVEVEAMQWTGTAAINEVKIFGQSTANFQAGSIVRLYGVT